MRQRFIAARVAATQAAGELDDPESIPVLAEMVDNTSVDGPVRAAAFWALARSNDASLASQIMAGRVEDWRGPAAEQVVKTGVSRDRLRHRAIPGG